MILGIFVEKILTRKFKCTLKCVVFGGFFLKDQPALKRHTMSEAHQAGLFLKVGKQPLRNKREM